MFNEYVKFQRFPLAILIFAQFFLARVTVTSVVKKPHVKKNLRVFRSGVCFYRPVS